jgi:2-keto-4-pentenoate hydratase/2-oxohepta-3-ene-1,7-dioic acid hydratase in catechol pathway
MTLLPGDLIACGTSVGVMIDDPGYWMSPSFSRRAFVEPNGISDILFRE